MRGLAAPWDCRLRGWKEACGRDSGFNEAPTLLDLREVSQSLAAKSTDGLWDCFVLGPEPKMAQTLKA